MSEFDFEATFGDDYLHFYLPMLTAERNEAEVEEIVAALDLTAGDRVLDAPCGHGRISNALSRRGIAVVGVDRTQQFLDLARRDADALGVTVNYRLGDLTDLDAVLDETFDAAINWFTSFGYHDDTTNKVILAGYHRVLRPGGTLLIETLHRDWFVRHHVPTPFAQVTSVGDDVMFDQSSFDPRMGRVNTVRTVIRDGLTRRSQHFVRLPSASELESWLEGAGFHDVAITARDGSPLTFDSRRMLTIARA
ncbi:MAG: methyltransferase domain-containing protein [Ilumatobacteraceae bacterium]